MDKGREDFQTVFSNANAQPIPSGQWPDGTGGSLVLPKILALVSTANSLAKWPALGHLPSVTKLHRNEMAPTVSNIVEPVVTRGL